MAKPLEELLHVFVDHAVVSQILAERFVLLGGWQFAVNQQVSHFGKLRILSQLLDGVAAVSKNPFLAVDEADFTFARSGVGIARVQRDRFRRSPELRDVDSDFVLRPDDNRQLVFLSVQYNFGRLIHLVRILLRCIGQPKQYWTAEKDSRRHAKQLSRRLRSDQSLPEIWLPCPNCPSVARFRNTKQISSGGLSDILLPLLGIVGNRLPFGNQFKSAETNPRDQARRDACPRPQLNSHARSELTSG